MRDWHATFSDMRGMNRRRWMRRGELVAVLRQHGVALSQWQLRAAIDQSPPTVFRHGMRHYTKKHVEAIRAFAEARGLVQKEVSDGS